MNPLLISGFGTFINVDKRRLVITNKIKDERLEFYPHKIPHDSIIIDGNTGNISFEALRWLMKHNINLTLLNWNGQLLSNTLPEQPKSGKLRINQYKKYLDQESRLYIASEFVRIKIEKSVELLDELSLFHSGVNNDEIRKMSENEKPPFFESKAKTGLNKNKDNFKSNVSGSLRQLMAYEGRVSEAYMRNLTQIFDDLCPEFRFTGRKNKENSRNYNASDEINALLNYGYSILESEVRKVVNSVGLDYSIGFLHEISQSRTPLVYDVQEMLRWIVDLSVIQLLEDKILKKSDFIITENYHTRLRESTAKLLIKKIHSNFNRKAPYKNNKNYSYHNILIDNVQNLANFILDKKKLEFNIPKITISRNDAIDVKEKILNMSVEERKSLRINKSTLWYLKKNLESGKKTKIYNKVLSKIQ